MTWRLVSDGRLDSSSCRQRHSGASGHLDGASPRRCGNRDGNNHSRSGADVTTVASTEADDKLAEQLAQPLVGRTTHRAALRRPELQHRTTALSSSRCAQIGIPVECRAVKRCGVLCRGVRGRRPRGWARGSWTSTSWSSPARGISGGQGLLLCCRWWRVATVDRLRDLVLKRWWQPVCRVPGHTFVTPSRRVT